MAHSAPDEYGSFGSVPNQQPLQGSGAGPLNVRANPEDFGAQIGEGIKNVGNTAAEVTQKFANIAMETAQNTAEVNFIKDAGDLKAKYMQLEGDAAVNARPQYEADMQALQQKHAEGLPLIAMHGYNVNTTRSLRFATSDYAGYAASQGKQALMDSGGAQVDIGKMKASDPSVASNDAAFGEFALAPIAHGSQTQLDLDHPGLKTDPETGIVNFDESKPEGQNLRAQFENNLNHHMGLAWETRFDTLSKTIGPIAAYDKFQQDKGDIPNPDSVVRLEASLQPQVMNAHANNIKNTVMTEAAQTQRQILTNPSSSGSNAYNLGNVKTAQGAASNTQDFLNPATPVDGAILTANNLRTKNYEGKTLDQIGHTWTSTDKDAWVKNVSAASGIDKNTVPDLNDPATMNKLLKGISVAEGKDKSIFTEDVISQGVTAALAGKQPKTTAGEPQKSYATNPDGSPLSLADYASTHRQYLLTKGDEYAEQTMPGSLQFRNVVRQRVSSQIESAINDQRADFSQNNNQIMRAYNGELTQGKKPASLDELEAIPGIRNNLNYSNVHTPDFIRTLEARLNSRAGGGDVDLKHYGKGSMEAFKDLTNGTIKDDHDIQQRFINGDLTAAGMKWMQEQLKSNQNPEGAADGKMLSAVLDAGKSRMDEDKSAWPSGLVAMTKMDNELKQKGIPASDRYDGIDNKNSILHALDPLISARDTPQAIADALSKIDEAKPGFVGAALEGPSRMQKRLLINDFQSGKYTADKAAGEKAIKTSYLNGDINDDDAMNMAIAYGYAAPKKAQ